MSAPVGSSRTTPDGDVRPAGAPATGAVAPDVVVTGIGVVAPGRPGEPWFDPRAELGGRGYRYAPAATRYLLAATRRAIVDGGRLDRLPPERRGAAVATNGGLEPLFAEMDRTVTGADATELSPALAPYFAINVLGTRLVAEHQLKGFHLTLTSPRVAGFEAVEAGWRALAVGRCDTLLVGVTEDGAEQGAVALVLERAGAAAGPGHGRLRAATLFVPPSAVSDRVRLTAALDRAFDRLAPRPAPATPGNLTTAGTPATLASPVELFGDGSPVADAVGAAVAELTGVNPVPRPVGAGCLAPMLRTARLFAGPPGEHRLVVATAEGNVAVVRVSVAAPAIREES
ncbi:beta-ketoacyl synthase N-terminal-like domain-containing protein [Plantactinospora sp. B5E13]|uniref:beta-ketoacyl synthase N-terminal-like domain-containing protein n=1 Tax=unclassified Plantactinospora TaxID=2631981 RepID=UPI00325DDA92